MRKKAFILCSLFIITSTIFMPVVVFSKEVGGESRLEAILSSVARPRLIYPDNKVVDLSGEKTLKFQWGLTTATLVALDYIEFYLYQGEVINEKNLVFGKRLANNEYSIEINSTLFEDGQFYTWGIRQFFLRGEKSNESFNLFKVFKK